MPKNTVSYSELTHQVVQQASEPLPFDVILERVTAITPITTKNPKQTIRHAVTQSRLIVATGDHRYGWKPRLTNGSVLRLTLSADDLANQRLLYTDEVRDALYPSFFGPQKRRDVGEITLLLPTGVEIALTMMFFGLGQWGDSGVPNLWHWLKSEDARSGDQLLITVLDGEARRYAVTFQKQVDRDEAAIAERNRATITALLPFVNRRGDSMIWELTSNLLAIEHYRHPVPPDPLVGLMASEEWQAAMTDQGLINGWNPLGTGISSILDLLLPAVSGVADTIHDDLDVQPTSTTQSPSQSPTIYVLRVTHRDFLKTWRDIEIAADQTLDDLHLAIQDAYHWGNDHLYSFFLNGKAWDARSEVGGPYSDSPRQAREVTLDSLKLKPKRKILYLFDYGDNHEFDVEVLAVNERSPKVTYPRVAGKQGRAPSQY